MRDKILSAIGEALSAKEGDEHYAHNAVMPEIEGFLIDCPECCTVRYDDDQYQCNTCEGRGYIRALEWITDKAADAVMEVVREEMERLKLKIAELEKQLQEAKDFLSPLLRDE